MPNKRIRKKLEKRRKFESDLIEGMRQAVAVARGEMDPARVTIVERRPDGTITRREMTGPEWRAWEREQKAREAAT